MANIKHKTTKRELLEIKEIELKIVMKNGEENIYYPLKDTLLQTLKEIDLDIWEVGNESIFNKDDK